MNDIDEKEPVSKTDEDDLEDKTPAAEKEKGEIEKPKEVLSEEDRKKQEERDKVAQIARNMKESKTNWQLYKTEEPDFLKVGLADDARGVVMEKDMELGIESNETQIERKKAEDALFFFGEKNENGDYTKNGEFLENNQFLDNEMLEKMINFNGKVPEKLVARGAKFGEVAYVNESQIHLLEGAYGKDKDGREFDRKHIVAHEIGHMLEFNYVIHSKEQFGILKKAIDAGSIEKLDESEKKQASPEFQDILDLFSNPENVNKESSYIIDLFGKLGSDGEMKKRMDFYNENHPKNKMQTLEDMRKMFKRDIAQEVIAEKLSFYMMAKEKTAGGMMLERVKQSPALEEYLGMNKDEITGVSTAIEKISPDIKKLGPDKILEELKGQNFDIEPDKLAKITGMIQENQRFFDLFHSQLKDKKPEDLKKLLKTGEMTGDEREEYDDMFDMMGGYSGDYESLGGGSHETSGGGGGGKGFFESISEFFQILFDMVK